MIKIMIEEYIKRQFEILEHKIKIYLRLNTEQEIRKQIREYNLLNLDEIRILVQEEVKIQTHKRKKL